MPSLPEDLKIKVRYHLGWPMVWTKTIINVTGYPHAITGQNLLEKNMDEIDVGGEARVRECVCELDAIEAERKAARGNAPIKKAGDVEMDVAGHFGILDDQKTYWRNELINALGGNENLYARGRAGGGGVAERFGRRAC
ncbi:MAG TPA: hypothetical protein PKA64_05960 [Myxococcota bacterium]|nr:hypothetical protein [Myxococcota bacterium]